MSLRAHVAARKARQAAGTVTERAAVARAMTAERSWAGTAHPTAALICAIGFFMRIVMSGPVLNILGINYGSEDASTLSKIHPGTYFILISFVVLLCSQRNPVEQIIRIAREQTAYFSFLLIYVITLVFWIARSPKGVGVLIDVHMVMPICAIVFCYAPLSFCRRIVQLYAAIAVINSLVGIFESSTHLRIFPFDPDWEVLNQDYFRASAFLGHPLTNASFAAVAMFVLLSLRMHLLLKAGIFLIMLSSLVAFGGRSALGFSVMGLAVLGVIGMRNYFATTQMGVLRLSVALLAIILVPAVSLGLLYGALHSGMGERLMAYSSGKDDSAGVRLLAFETLDYLSPTDIMLGVDSDRIDQIGSATGVTNPTSDIENPWVLMFLFLGAFMFTLWLLGLCACVWRLMAGASPALKLAVIEYFLISSTSNSFGRKDPVYLVLAGIVVCAKRVTDMERQRLRLSHD